MASLPSYLAAARPVPLENRAPWYKNVMPSYFGIMLWFVFWQDLVTAGAKTGGHPAGVIAEGFPPAFVGLIIAAVICHFFFYMAPALLGMRTGLPLYVVGSSTYGASGGRYMPGFLMGILQFGWVAVNAWAVAGILCTCFGLDPTSPGMSHGIIATAFAVLAGFMGLKGIKYVARVSTWLPLIPVAVLIGLICLTAGGLPGLNNPGEPSRLTALAGDVHSLDNSPYIDMSSGYMTYWQIVSVLVIYIVGFFATAGAAGADIASNCRNENDVHVGGITGILLPTVLTGEVVLMAVGGAYGGDMVSEKNFGNYNLVGLIPDIMNHRFGNSGPTISNIIMIALAISSFPAACFSALIAANSFKTVMPKINPWVSVGVGTLAAVALAVSGWAGEVSKVFGVIGASFGPVCGAMLADFLMSGRRWSGPRASFNPAGWISWAVGFVVGAFNLVVDLLLTSKWEWVGTTFPNLADYKDFIYVPPVTAFVVGFALYVALSVVGVRTRKLLGPDGRLLD